MFELWCAYNRIVNTLVANFDDASNNTSLCEVPFYGFDFDSSVEMLAVAVALFTFTLLFFSAHWNRVLQFQACVPRVFRDDCYRGCV